MTERVATIVGITALLFAGGWYAWPRLFPRTDPAAVEEARVTAILDGLAERQRALPAPVPVGRSDREVLELVRGAGADGVVTSLTRLRQTVEESGETAARRAGIGWLLLIDNQFEEARKELDRALELDPKGTLALVADGYDHLRRGKFAKAEASLARATAQNPDVADWYRLRATVLLAVGKTGEAMAAAERSVLLAGQSPTSYLSVGDVHLREARFEEALFFYDAACRLAGPDSEITRRHESVREALRERVGG